MLYVSQWSYIKNSQDRKVCNFMLIVPQWIHSVETLETCFYYYVYNKLWSLCMIFEVVRIITSLLEIYRHVYICVSYMHKYQRSEFPCMNSGEDIFEAVSNHFSSWNLLGCVLLHFMYPYVPVFFYSLDVWVKASLIKIYVIFWK